MCPLQVFIPIVSVHFDDSARAAAALSSAAYSAHKEYSSRAKTRGGSAAAAAAPPAVPSARLEPYASTALTSGRGVLPGVGGAVPLLSLIHI